jgi:CheY-like chemotaxis protein
MQRLINILLVEDDTLDQIEVKRTLEKKGILHQLTIARNGEEALSILSSDSLAGKPDIILLDLDMPKMNGYEFMTRLKGNRDWKDIKIFILTTSDDREEKNAALNFGISGFITKPLKLESPSSIDAINLMIDMMNLQIR